MRPVDIGRIQAAKLRDLLREILPANPFYCRKLAEARFQAADLDCSPPLDAMLASLPLTTKAELEADQAAHPPYGSDLTYPPERYTRLHRTSGTSGRPLVWLDTRESWRWFIECWKRVYRGMGLRPDDRVFFPFSFGPFIGFWGAFEAAQALGVFCLPGGGMSTSARLRHLIEHRATVVTCTPTYALRLAEVAQEEGIDLASSAVRALVVAGEPGGHVPATRRRLGESWGARVFDHHGMTEIGCVTYEVAGGPGGLHAVEEEFIVEVLRPAETSRATPGEAGELVLTSLGRWGSPLIRYRTGDLVRWVEEDPCVPRADGTFGTGRFEGGILGRIDDMFFIRGNNVYPSAIEAVVREFAEVAEYRLRVLESADMTALEVEIEPRAPVAAQPPASDAAAVPGRRSLDERVARAIEDRLLFRAQVRLVPPGTLPRFETKSRRLERAPMAARGPAPAKPEGRPAR